MEPYTILTRLLEQIEQNLQSDEKLKPYINNAAISETHLRRLFRFAFNMPLVSYIRARKLAASIPYLLQPIKRVIDVAAMFDFEYEQTYIRVFKQQFGITPGEFRQTQPVLEIVPPMHLLDRNRLGDNLIFGPSVVMVPGFHVVGKLHKMLLNESYYKAPEAGANFWLNEKPLITNIVEPSVYYGLTRLTAAGQNSSYYLPSVKVQNLNELPEGFSGDSIPTSVCVRFRYVGQHDCFEINQERARRMYEAIGQYLGDKDYRCARTDLELCWERIDGTAYDGEFCCMEWFAPIRTTLKNGVPSE